MLYASLTPKAIVIVLVFGSVLLIDRSCAMEDVPVAGAQERHRAAMKDLGRNDHVPVRTPW